MSDDYVPSKKIPEILSALQEEVGKDEGLNMATRLLQLNIPNVTSYNPHYTTIAYIILSETDKKILTSPDVFIRSKPGEEIKYRSYHKKTVPQYIKESFGVLPTQQDLLIKHLEMVYTYLKNIGKYLYNDIEDLEGIQAFIQENEDEEFFEDEEEDY